MLSLIGIGLFVAAIETLIIFTIVRLNRHSSSLAVRFIKRMVVGITVILGMMSIRSLLSYFQLFSHANWQVACNAYAIGLIPLLLMGIFGFLRSPNK